MKNEDIKGLDVKKGMALVANNKAIYLRLLKSFVNNSFCDQLIEAIANGDMEQVSLKAHSFKGVAGNMHMAELYELSRLIEADVKNGVNITAADDNVIKIIDANAQTLKSVNMILEGPDVLDTIS